MEGLLVVGVLQGFPSLLLPLMVGIDSETHELVERHAVLGIDVEQLRRDAGEPQPLAYDIDRDEKGGSDLLFGLALLAQGHERAELIERMERRALDVLGERIFLGGDNCIGRADNAGNGCRLSQALLPDQ